MFSLAHVDQVANAYITGLERLVKAGGDPAPVKSVASLFLSRVDTLVDNQLNAMGNTALQGLSGVALARLAYAAYQKTFDSPRFEVLASRGAMPQYMLWASTGTKNAAYSDVLYVESLIGPDTINTVPDATLDAFRDHGKAAATLTSGLAQAHAQFDALALAGVDMHAAGQQLQNEGVKLFEKAFDDLLKLLA